MEELDTVLSLHKTRKIDWLLRVRIIILIILALLFAVTVVFDIVEYRANPWPVLYFSLGGFIAGYAWFYKMIPVHWDESRQLMRIKRFDISGVFFVLLYVASRIILSYVLESESSSVIGVSIATYSAVCGIMVGRIFGLFRVIHLLHKQSKEPSA